MDNNMKFIPIPSDLMEGLEIASKCLAEVCLTDNGLLISVIEEDNVGCSGDCESCAWEAFCDEKHCPCCGAPLDDYEDEDA